MSTTDSIHPIIVYALIALVIPIGSTIIGYFVRTMLGEVKSEIKEQGKQINQIMINTRAVEIEVRSIVRNCVKHQYELQIENNENTH